MLNLLYNLLLLALPRKMLRFFSLFDWMFKDAEYITPVLCDLANLRGDGCWEGKRGSFLPSHCTAALHALASVLRHRHVNMATGCTFIIKACVS